MVKFPLIGSLEFNQVADAPAAFIVITVGARNNRGESVGPFTEVLRQYRFNFLPHIVTICLWSVFP
jgi:hypothetical protein